MITILAIMGGLGFLGLVIACILFLFDTPDRERRQRVEVAAQEAAWQIHQHTRRAVEQMLDEARRRRP